MDDQNLSFTEYQEQAKTTAIYPEAFKVIYPLLGLVNEAGEVAGKVKKIIRDKNGVMAEEDIVNVAGEIGDVLWYLAVLAHDLDLNFSSIAASNLSKLKSRQERGVLGGSGDNR